MKLLDTVRKVRLAGYDVTESEGDAHDAIGERPWGAPRVTVKQSRLFDLEPKTTFKRGAVVIFFGESVSDLVTGTLSREELTALCDSLSRRYVRELHDAAMELSQARRSYMEDRQRRLANKA